MAAPYPNQTNKKAARERDGFFKNPRGLFFTGGTILKAGNEFNHPRRTHQQVRQAYRLRDAPQELLDEIDFKQTYESPVQSANDNQSANNLTHRTGLIRHHSTVPPL
jgi:hypothetical protein